MEVGKRLKAAQELLANQKTGSFLAWLQTEFHWSQKQAYNFIHVYDKFSNVVNFTSLDIATSALYALTAPDKEGLENSTKALDTRKEVAKAAGVY